MQFHSLIFSSEENIIHLNTHFQLHTTRLASVFIQEVFMAELDSLCVLHLADYHFTTREAMQEGIDKGDFIENAEFSGNMYGTR